MSPLKNPLFKAPDRRYKIMTVTPDILMNALFSPTYSPGDRTVRVYSLTDADGKPLPEDVRADAIAYDDLRDLIYVRLWSASWPVMDTASHLPDVGIAVTARELEVVDPAEEARRAAVTHDLFSVNGPDSPYPAPSSGACGAGEPVVVKIPPG